MFYLLVVGQLHGYVVIKSPRYRWFLGAQLDTDTYIKNQKDDLYCIVHNPLIEIHSDEMDSI